MATEAPAERREGGDHRTCMTPTDHAAEIVWKMLGGKRPANLDEMLAGRQEAVRQEVIGLFDRLEATPETDPRLQPYKAHYYRWPRAMQTRYPWAAVRIRLLTDTAEGGEPLLTAAEGLVEAVFFGMDAEGNPMFADGKEDPRKLPHCGLGYEATRRLVLFKEDEEEKQIPTGYAMFPYLELDEVDGKSGEILSFERFTKKPFVSSKDGEWVESWVESGEEPRRPRRVYFNLRNGYAYVSRDRPNGLCRRGVRRLLRGQRA